MRSSAREGTRRMGRPSAMKSPWFQSMRKTASISPPPEGREHRPGFHPGAVPGHPAKVARAHALLGERGLREGLQVREVARDGLALQIGQRAEGAPGNDREPAMRAPSLAV